MTQTVELQKKGLDRIRVFSGAQLKYIAFLSMLIDHVNKALIYPYLNGGLLLKISDLFDVLGRIAFPLFAFFIVEGFFKTRSRKKYLLNLLIFGVISEVPFDMFTTRTFFNPRYNNVLFALALSLVTIWIIDTLKIKLEKIPRFLWYLTTVLILAVMCIISLLSCVFGYLSIFKEVWALLGFGFILMYNGKRGRQNKMINYWFYPVHILILGILRMVFNI